MGLLTDIRNAATDSSQPLSDALRKGLILASLLRNAELKQWLKNELEGYDFENVPDYRVINASIYADFVDEYGRRQKHIRVPTETYPDRWREALTRLKMGRGVRELEDHTRDEYTALVLDATVLPPIIEGMTAETAVHRFHRSSVLQVLDAIRTRLLELVLDLEERFPEMKISEEEISKVDRVAAASVVTVHVHGSQNNVAAGHEVVQNVSQQIREGDVQMLVERLVSAGVPNSEVENLKKAILADGTPPAGKLGTRVASWLGKMTTKAVEGSIAVAPGLLLELVKKHYGL